MVYLIIILLIIFSALFSGLTLGLLSLDAQTLKRRAELGDAQAAAIYPIRQNGNLLLTTLLLGNVAVNTTLSIFLGSVAGGVIAAIAATTLIFIFGEIIPQAVISRHALYFGALTAPLVRVIIWLFFPIAYPIAYVLNKLLGDEIPTHYSHHEIMQIISEHEDSEHSAIDEDEERIVHGALQFSHRKVREVMTPLTEVIAYDENQKLTTDFLEEINDHGYSRYPIFSGKRENIVGILFTKDLIVEDDDIAIKDTEDAFESTYLKARADENLDIVLARMLKQKRHLGIVSNRNKTWIGVITLEDIIEEIIQYEIEDEDDVNEAQPFTAEQ
ncbi:CNNM domain-containing protein [Candidatus Pacebacteria bacterium]|nr:CNNM domain-containing protein [Candidatus Paceibacterota bacterium]